MEIHDLPQVLDAIIFESRVGLCAMLLQCHRRAFQTFWDEESKHWDIVGVAGLHRE